MGIMEGKIMKSLHVLGGLNHVTETVLGEGSYSIIHTLLKRTGLRSFAESRLYSQHGEGRVRGMKTAGAHPTHPQKIIVGESHLKGSISSLIPEGTACHRVKSHSQQ